MGLVFDNGVSQYVAPLWLTLKGMPFGARIDYENRAMGHGSIITTDKKIGAREITLMGTTNYYRTKESHDAAVRELITALYRGTQKMVIDGRHYINVDLYEYDHSFEEMMGRRMSTAEITLVATDPFIYAMEETTFTENVSTSPMQFIIANPGQEAYPVITITSSDTNAAMSLKNTSDGNRTFGYTDAQFTAGKVLVIDSVAGTVKRDGTSTINNMGGTFLKLLPGDNVLEYTGTACSISVAHRQRWL